LQLQIASANPGQKEPQDEEGPPSQIHRSISSTLSRARVYGKIPASTAVGSGSEASSAGGKQAEAAQSLAAIADSVYRSQLRPAGDVFRLPGAESASEPLRPPAGSDGGTVTQGAVLSDASKPLSVLSPGAPPASASTSGSLGSPGASEVETAAESASRFVRAAALANASGGQRLHVLLQDDQLGRISLRMVDRAAGCRLCGCRRRGKARSSQPTHGRGSRGGSASRRVRAPAAGGCRAAKRRFASRSDSR
jgi:hypothetical protein